MTNFTETAATYADTLRAAGFTVYAPVKPDGRPVSWFHYSRDVDGQTCYGTFDDGTHGFDGPQHRMPIKPSRLNGSGAHIGARWGDPDTLNLDALPVESVEYATIVARPSNWCPYNYPAGTPEGSRRAATGATLNNAEPWGIGTHYAPIV